MWLWRWIWTWTDSVNTSHCPHEDNQDVCTKTRRERPSSHGWTNSSMTSLLGGRGRTKKQEQVEVLEPTPPVRSLPWILFTFFHSQKLLFFRTHLNIIIDVRIGVGIWVYTQNLKVLCNPYCLKRSWSTLACFKRLAPVSFLLAPVILVSRTQVFQIEQSGIEINWITGAPYARSL